MNIAPKHNAFLGRDLHSSFAECRKGRVLAQAAAALCMMGAVALSYGAEAPPTQDEPHAASAESSAAAAAACAAHLPLDHGPHEATTPFLNKKHFEECLSKSAAHRSN